MSMTLSGWKELYEYWDKQGRPMPKKDEGPPPLEPQPTGAQTRSLSWTGYQLTVRELRGWLNPLPDHATINLWREDDELGIHAEWEVTP